MLINVQNVEVLNNPTAFTNHMQFEITFDCLPPGVKEELEWKLTYVSSAQDQSLDQELDSVLVGPVAVGRNKFVFETPAPDASKIPIEDLLDVTAVMLTGNYREREFIRVGYYVNTQFNYPLPADADGKPILPTTLDTSKLVRTIAANKPRVTRFQIPWDDVADELLMIEQSEQSEAKMGDEEVAMGDEYAVEEEEDEEDEEDGEEMEIDLDDE